MTNAEHKIKWYFKHKRSKKSALKVLKKIESYKGKTDTKLIKLANEYAIDVLGSKVYAPWLYVFTALHNEFKEGWIPDNYYKKEVVPKLKGEYGILASRNFITPILFSNFTTLDLGYFINGKFITTHNEILKLNDVKNFIFKNDDKLVYKLENSKSGKGVSVFTKENFDISQFISDKYSNGVFQKFIKQHPFFSEFTKDSVATIRVTTTSDVLGNISVRAAYIRFARNNETHVSSKSAINVSINLNTGVLQPKGYMNWTEINDHPDSKISFRNKKIPHFKKCITKALEMHSKLPFMGCIGWDLTIDKFDNVQLIEWNGKNNDIKLSEATTGPCFIGLDWENLWKEKQI